MGRVLETVPVGFVPVAWLFAAAAVAGMLAEQTVLIGLGVMTTIQIAFAAAPDMSEGVLERWRWLIFAGAGANIVAIGGIVGGFEAIAAVSLYAWILLPAFGLLETGKAVGDTRRYELFAACSLAGGAVVVLGQSLGSLTATVAGFVIVAAGQSASVAVAATR
ncbi:MAG: hypothetical protein PPP58_12360 [Natronomonas sp.]